jgi:hypothetical protein
VANRPGYFQGYYSENKEQILKARRERYASDPEYREKVLKSSREYRKNQRRTPRVKTRRYQKPIVGTSADGTEVQLCSVGALAIRLQRSVQAINHWQKKELIPETPYQDGRGFRFYTPAMMDAIATEVGAKRRLFPVDPDMRERIRQKWASCGVPVSYTGESIDEAIRLTTAPKV